MTGRTLTVSLGERSYPIHIGPGLLADPAVFVPHLRSGRAALVTNDVVAPLYADRVARTLEQAGARVQRIVLPDGEARKDSQTLDRVYSALLAEREGKEIYFRVNKAFLQDIFGKVTSYLDTFL